MVVTVATYVSTAALPADVASYGASQIENSFAASDAAVSEINISYCKEHTKNSRPSTRGKHQAGQTRKSRDSGSEKAMQEERQTPINDAPKSKHETFSEILKTLQIDHEIALIYTNANDTMKFSAGYVLIV